MLKRKACTARKETMFILSAIANVHGILVFRGDRFPASQICHLGDSAADSLRHARDEYLRHP